MSNLQIFLKLQLLAKTQLLLKILHQILWFQAARLQNFQMGIRLSLSKWVIAHSTWNCLRQKESPVAPATNDGYQYPSVRHLAFKVDSVDAKLTEIGNDAKITLGPLTLMIIFQGTV